MVWTDRHEYATATATGVSRTGGGNFLEEVNIASRQTRIICHARLLSERNDPAVVVP